jgi:hypothetical protein
MPYCKRCGAEYQEGAKFCIKCGSSITEEWKPPRDECFGEKKQETDYIGLASFGIFLLIVAYLFLTNPLLGEDIVSFFTNLSDAKFLPSGRLIDIFTLFLILIGAWSFVEAGIRAAIKQPFRKSLSGVFTGVAFIIFAYLVSRYSQGTLDWQIALVLEIIIIGILIILYGIIVSQGKMQKSKDTDTLSS